MRQDEDDPFVSVEEAGGALGISRSTVWRLIRRGSIPSIRRGGRRVIPKHALIAIGASRVKDEVPPLTADHPIFRLAGAGRSGGNKPGARDKHAILDR
jgi:excisionase family DNA binding protein